MTSSLIVSIIAVFLAFLNSKKVFKYGLESAFIIITIFLSIRYDWGNDYSEYMNLFENIQSSNLQYKDWESFYLVSGRFELGWVFLNIFFRPIGFFGMVIIFTIFENFVLYKFIKETTECETYWLSVFIYCFASSFLLIGSSMMREWLAVSLCIISYRYIQRQKLLPFLILVIIASTIHKSALIFLPAYFISYIKDIKLKRYWFPIFIFIYILLAVILPDLLRSNMGFLLSFESFQYYERYTSAETSGFALGNILPVVISLICLSEASLHSRDIQKLIVIFAISSLTYAVTGIVPLLDRMGYYFNVAQICVIPIVYGKIKSNDLIKNVLLFILILLTLRGYFQFFESKIWGASFMDYKTIFSTTWR